MKWRIRKKKFKLHERQSIIGMLMTVTAQDGEQHEAIITDVTISKPRIKRKTNADYNFKAKLI